RAHRTHVHVFSRSCRITRGLAFTGGRHRRAAARGDGLRPLPVGERGTFSSAGGNCARIGGPGNLPVSDRRLPAVRVSGCYRATIGSRAGPKSAYRVRPRPVDCGNTIPAVPFPLWWGSSKRLRIPQNPRLLPIVRRFGYHAGTFATIPVLAGDFRRGARADSDLGISR